MNILETDDWCLLLPPEWVVEQDAGFVRIFDQDEISELSFSTLIRDKDIAIPIEALQLAKSQSPEVSIWKPITIGDFEGVTGSLREDNEVIREWYVSQAFTLLYVTYVCGYQHGGMDDLAIDNILSTLVSGDALRNG